MLASSILQMPYPLMPEVIFPSRAMLGDDCRFGAGDIQAKFADRYSEHPRRIESPIIIDIANSIPDLAKRFAKTAFHDGLSLSEAVSCYNIGISILKELCMDRAPAQLSAKASRQEANLAQAGLRLLFSSAQAAAMSEFMKCGALVRKDMPTDKNSPYLPFNCRSHILPWQDSSISRRFDMRFHVH